MNYLKLIKDDFIYKEYSKIAYKTIISDLIVLNKKGISRAVDLEYWSDEADFAKYDSFIPGNFYIFLYNGEKVVQNNLEYHDRVPVMLSLGVASEQKTNRRYVYGLNFNLLPALTRALILQEINDMDNKFFEEEIYKLHSKGQHPFSKVVLKALGKDGGYTFVNAISQKYKIDKNSFAFRRYYIDKISKYRLIDVWQWKYLPFLEYQEGIRGVELKKIQKQNAKMTK